MLIITGAQVRTVILKGLPDTSDFTLVQSLIHGGAIEAMRMIPVNAETGTTSACVTLTSPEAFNKYYSKYPNGFELRYKGKKYNVLVDKQEHVNVMSSAMNAYLECGATRVLKVQGAEDDWGVVALHKMAIGKANGRQLEAITDTYRNSASLLTLLSSKDWLTGAGPHHFLPLHQHSRCSQIQSVSHSRYPLGGLLF